MEEIVRVREVGFVGHNDTASNWQATCSFRADCYTAATLGIIFLRQNPLNSLKLFSNLVFHCEMSFTVFAVQKLLSRGFPQTRIIHIDRNFCYIVLCIYVYIYILNQHACFVPDSLLDQTSSIPDSHSLKNSVVCIFFSPIQIMM